MISVLIAGDLCPIGRNLPLFQKGNAQSLFNDLLPEFKQADMSIVNLECPLIQKNTPIEKMGPVLGADQSCINGIAAAGIDVVNLANNHIMDHGPQGLQTTIEACQLKGIDYVGAGKNLQEARRIYVRNVKGLRIGILSVAEHEFSIASKNTPGANPLDMIEFVRNIRKCRSTFDYLIVLLHGGNEHYPYPRPDLMNICRFMVEEGANTVICQQSHCPGCRETYRNAHIVYGQGNFIFDMSTPHKDWNKGILILLQINNRFTTRMKLIPSMQSDGQTGARKMTIEEKDRFLQDFDARSEAILDESFVEAQWQDFCRQHENFFLNTLHGNNSLLRRVAGKLKILRYFDSRKRCRARLHLIRCESLREVMIAVLSRRSRRNLYEFRKKRQ